MRRLQLLAVLIGGLLLALTATASPLAPGGCLATPTTAACPTSLDIFNDSPTLLANRSDIIASGSGALHGTLTSAVLRNSAGTLDFYYQFSNDASSTDWASRITMNPFTGFSTDAGFRTTAYSIFTSAGTNAPLEADRAIAGDVVGFQFNNTLTGSPGNRVNPGQVSDILVVRTNAVNFTTGFASVIDGSAATVFSYAPLRGGQDIPTPEPATFGMIGAVLVGAAVWRRRSRRT